MKADNLLLIIAFYSNALAAPQERLGNVLETAGLNSVPMMGRKRAPIDLPSFTSGFLPPKYPKYMRVRTNKRGEEKTSLAATWASIMGSRPASMYNNVPGKRRPWTSSWANIMVKPASLYQNSPPGKRTAVPSDWGSGYDNLLRSPQGFRFHSGGQDYLARDLLFKRAKEVVRPVPEKKDETKEEEKKKKKSEDPGPKIKKDAEPSAASTVEEESQENGVETSFEPFNNQWLENFESLMADASLVRALLPPFMLSTCLLSRFFLVPT